MSVYDETVRGLAGVIKARNPKTRTSAYDTPATVRRVENGVAYVHIDGGVDETPVNLTIDAKPGDTVMVRVSGGSAWIMGNGSSPPTDDTRANRAMKKAEDVEEAVVEVVRSVESVSEVADDAKEIAEAGREIAEATDQYFWVDASGTHVATAPKESDPSGTNGFNALWNALGMLLRNGTNILAQFGQHAVAFYDGDGNDGENIVASFGKDGGQVGYSSSGHLMFSSNSIVAVSDIGAKLFSVGTNQATEQVLITKDLGTSIKVTSTSSSNPTSMVVTLPITDEVTGGALRIDYEWYGYSSDQQSTFRYRDTFEGVIGTAKSEDVHADRIGLHLNYSRVTMLGKQVDNFWVDAFKTSSYNTFFRVISVTYDGNMPMPTYDLGTRALANNFAGSFSSVIGESLFATGDRQIALGKFNVEDTNDEYVLIIGNGTDDQNRSNALTVDWNGKVTAAGGYGGLVATEDVPLTVSFAAGTIGTRAASLSAGSIVKSGYTYIGAYVADHRNTSYFSATIAHNGPNNTAHLIVTRATGNAVTDADVTVRKIWLKTG